MVSTPLELLYCSMVLARLLFASLNMASHSPTSTSSPLRSPLSLRVFLWGFFMIMPSLVGIRMSSSPSFRFKASLICLGMTICPFELTLALNRFSIVEMSSTNPDLLYLTFMSYFFIWLLALRFGKNRVFFYEDCFFKRFEVVVSGYNFCF